MERGHTARMRRRLSTPVESRVEPREIPANQRESARCGQGGKSSLRRRPGRCYARHPEGRTDGSNEGVLNRVEGQIELTAEDLWNDVSARLREALNDTTYSTWFGEVGGAELDADTFAVAVPNDFTREWIEGHFLDLIRAAVKDAGGADLRVQLRVLEEPPLPVLAALGRTERRSERGPAAPGRGDRGPHRRRRDQPEVHVRLVRDRLVEPVRPRGRAGRGRGARRRRTTRSSSTGTRASARPTSCTPWRTSSPTTAAGSPAAT